MVSKSIYLQVYESQVWIDKRRPWTRHASTQVEKNNKGRVSYLKKYLGFFRFFSFNFSILPHSVTHAPKSNQLGQKPFSTKVALLLFRRWERSDARGNLSTFLSQIAEEPSVVLLSSGLGISCLTVFSPGFWSAPSRCRRKRRRRTENACTQSSRGGRGRWRKWGGVSSKLVRNYKKEEKEEEAEEKEAEEKKEEGGGRRRKRRRKKRRRRREGTKDSFVNGT